MANYENIRPYSELVHRACEGGGPKKFLEDHALANYNLGVMDERASWGWKGCIIAAATLTIWEGAKAGYRRIKKVREERVMVEKAKAQIAANNITHCLEKYEEGYNE